MRAVLLVVMGILLAGCASPPATSPTPATTGPVDAGGELGLLAIDTTTRAVTLLSSTAQFAWMSPTGSLVVWDEGAFSVLLKSQTNERQVVPRGAWVRIYDNATGLETAPMAALWREIVAAVPNGTAPLPEAPLAGTRWTGASDDLAVLGVEYAVQGTNCANDVFVRSEESVRTHGCHLRVAADGRAGWTEGGAVRVRARDGNITNLTGHGGGDIARNAYIQHENPVFTSDSLVYLRVTGGEDVVLNEVVAEDGTVIAKIEGPARAALLDVSNDGRFLLVRAFTR